MIARRLSTEAARIEIGRSMKGTNAQYDSFYHMISLLSPGESLIIEAETEDAATVRRLYSCVRRRVDKCFDHGEVTVAMRGTKLYIMREE